jgi:nicotinamidase-related amidase
VITNAAQLAAVPDDLLPGILKTARMGYDGKGQARVATRQALQEAWQSLSGVTCVLEKMSFSCMGDSAIAARLMELKAAGRRQILICGIEAHVCVLQSAIAAKAAGFDVFVAADATSSRASASKALALSRMSHAGVQIVSTEMAIFEWLAVAGTADFKALMPLVK